MIIATSDLTLQFTPATATDFSISVSVSETNPSQFPEAINSDQQIVVTLASVGVIVFLFAVFILICQFMKYRKKYELHNCKLRIKQSWID